MARATCTTSSRRMPSSSSCFGLTRITPTSVVSIASMPSVYTEMECVRRARSNRSFSCAKLCQPRRTVA